ncbi:MAG: glutathione peroxidase [Betaproteobacteria bacterium]
MAAGLFGAGLAAFAGLAVAQGQAQAPAQVPVQAPAAGPAGLSWACPSLLDHAFPDLISGKPISLCQFRGKVLRVVNTASECGFTPQYEQLEALHRKLSPRGLVVVGFPSNDFQQERGSNREIAEFCKLNYGVSFPMMEPTAVSGRKANPFHAELTRRSGTAPGWNFHKYLVDRSGNRVQSFPTAMRPDDPKLVREIERLLAQAPAPGR